MKKIFLLGILCLIILGLHAQYTSFKPGEIWKDNKGIHINAHGGGYIIRILIIGLESIRQKVQLEIRHW